MVEAYKEPVAQAPLGIFGGTFDPVHCGHIAMAQQARKALGLQQVAMMPCHQPYHRDAAPHLSSQQRQRLLQLALEHETGLVLDDRELQRQGATYSVDSLTEIRTESGSERPLVLCMGMDSWLSFASWHCADRIRELAHIAVMARPGYEICLDDFDAVATSATGDTLSAHNCIRQRPAGALVLLELELLDISATAIRAQLACGNMPDTLPPRVAGMIDTQGLYGYHGS